jgi:hypothetical protein
MQLNSYDDAAKLSLTAKPHPTMQHSSHLLAQWNHQAKLWNNMLPFEGQFQHTNNTLPQLLTEITETLKGTSLTRPISIRYTALAGRI